MSRKKKLKKKRKEEPKQFMILSDVLRGDYCQYKGTYLKVRNKYISGTNGYADVVPVFDVIHDHVVSHEEGTFCGLVPFNMVGGMNKCIKCRCGNEWIVHGPLYIQVASAIEDFVCRMNEHFDPEEYTYGAYKSKIERKKQSHDCIQKVENLQKIEAIKAADLKRVEDEKIERREHASKNPISSLEI